MTKVRYTGASQEQINWGGCDDPRPILKVGEIYDVEKIYIHSWHTKIQLIGHTGKFNSVCFEEIEDDNKGVK
jgi:hypothetical protein